MTLPNCKCCKYDETKRCDYCTSYSEFDYEEGSLSALEALYDAPDREKRIAELEKKIKKIRDYLAYKIPHELMNEATNKIWYMV